MNPIYISFRSGNGLKFFRNEWRKRIGGFFRPVRRNGENYGYQLRTPFELNAALEIEALRPGTIMRADLLALSQTTINP